jgi:hypothetical protein
MILPSMISMGFTHTPSRHTMSAIKEQRDWANVVASLASESACPTKNDANVVMSCADCDHLWIKTAVEGNTASSRVTGPGSETSAGSLLQLMQRSARAAGYQ